MGQLVRLGRASWVGGTQGEQTAAWLAVGETHARAFLFADASATGRGRGRFAALRARGQGCVAVSGDIAPGPGRTLAKRLKIDDWQAEALPQDKAARIAELSAQGCKVLMVGDGLNDTAALAAAHVSISPASALDAARVASDIVLLGMDLTPIAEACDTAKRATRRIRENFRIATVYNVIAVPLAVAGLATPLIAALAMSASSITVSLNALRLR